MGIEIVEGMIRGTEINHPLMRQDINVVENTGHVSQNEDQDQQRKSTAGRLTFGASAGSIKS